jgi:pyruvate dehydrogenase (quinone)
VFTSLGYERPRTLPHPSELERAARVLNAGKRVAMLVGAGARGATDELLEVAELLGAGVAKALLGKDVVPDDAACCTGSIGLLGTRASWELMQGCDTLLLVGTGFPYAEFLPEEGQARAVQIDIDARMLGARYPLEAALVPRSARRDSSRYIWPNTC